MSKNFRSKYLNKQDRMSYANLYYYTHTPFLEMLSHLKIQFSHCKRKDKNLSKFNFPQPCFNDKKSKVDLSLTGSNDYLDC